MQVDGSQTIRLMFQQTFGEKNTFAKKTHTNLILAEILVFSVGSTWNTKTKQRKTKSMYRGGSYRPPTHWAA